MEQNTQSCLFSDIRSTAGSPVAVKNRGFSNHAPSMRPGRVLTKGIPSVESLEANIRVTSEPGRPVNIATRRLFYSTALSNNAFPRHARRSVSEQVIKTCSSVTPASNISSEQWISCIFGGTADLQLIHSDKLYKEISIT